MFPWKSPLQRGHHVTTSVRKGPSFSDFPLCTFLHPMLPRWLPTPVGALVSGAWLQGAAGMAYRCQPFWSFFLLSFLFWKPVFFEK